MDIVHILEQMAVLFVIIALGYLGNKLKILNADSNRALTKLAINIAMPCTIINSVSGTSMDMGSGGIIAYIGISLLVYGLSFLIAFFVPFVLRGKKEDAGMYRFMVGFGNVGFMGYPVAEAVFGSAASFYVALFNIPASILGFSVGIMMISSGRGKINPKLFINPPFIAGIVAVILFLANIKLPGVIADTCSVMSKLTTPFAMLIIGSTLAAIPLRDVFSEWRIYAASAFKLIIVPVVTWLLLRLFVHDSLALGVAVLMAACPIATNATMLSMEYGGNEKLGSTGIFISTLFSIATIPLLVYVLLM